jgi:hypothetical protein
MLKDILNDNGKEGVELYKQSLTQNDRVATGDTVNSIRFEVVGDESKASLRFYALDHIRDLEEGQTAQQIQQKGDFFSQLNRWVQSKGLGDSGVTGLIMRSLQNNGWNTDLPNRTGQNGGTKGLITDVDAKVVENVNNSLKKSSKSLILEKIRSSNNGNIRKF